MYYILFSVMGRCDKDHHVTVEVAVEVAAAAAVAVVVVVVVLMVVVMMTTMAIKYLKFN